MDRVAGFAQALIFYQLVCRLADLYFSRHRELMTIAFAQAGLPPKIRGSEVSGYFLRAIGMFHKDVGEVSKILYQFEKPLIVDHSKFEGALGGSATTHDEALEQTLAWYKENPL